MMEDKVLEFICKAEELYKRKFKMPSISYALRGTTAGWANHFQWSLRLNPSILDTPEKVHQVVGHEVAHLIAWEVYGDNIKPHGPHWKTVMVRFGLEPKRCHSYACQKARKVKRYPFTCGCQTFQLTSVRANRIKRGYEYRCGKCGNSLTEV